MASRQQEKERRRRERLERERREAAAAARRQRLQFAGGGLLGALLVAGAIVLAVGALGGRDSGPSRASAPSGVRLPPQRLSELDTAAKAAGCTVQNPPDEGRAHANRQFTAADYRTNPPTSGTHFPEWAQDGIYESGGAPQLGMLVHTLEHGRIDVQYRPGTPRHVEQQLEALLAEESNGYHMLLFENQTGMRYQVAATAWTHLLGCPQMNDKVFDALRAFRAEYIDRGPEKVP